MKRVKTIGVHSLLILSVILTVISAGITYLNVLQKKEATGLVIHHYKVIQASTRLLSLMKDMEIGMRGYLITSDSTFLEPYQEARGQIDANIDTLTALVMENPRQMEILQQRLLRGGEVVQHLAVLWGHHVAHPLQCAQIGIDPAPEAALQQQARPGPRHGVAASAPKGALRP